MAGTAAAGSTAQKAATQKTAAQKSAASASLNAPAVRSGVAPAAAVVPQATPIPGSGTTRNVSLCVAVQRAQTSVDRGQAASWIVTAWTKGGNVPDAVVHLAAAPASLSPQISFGCGTNDGTAKCDLGEVAANSARRQLQAEVVVPATATTVTSVRLKVSASAAHLPKDPVANATVSVLAAPAGTGAGAGAGAGGGVGGAGTGTSPLPLGSLPFVDTPSTTLSPGGNAGGLFPTVNPSPELSPSTPGPQQASAQKIANASALPLGASVVGAQLVGLGVLALAFVLAVTRLSIRRRPVTGRPAAAQATSGAGAAPPAGSARDASAANDVDGDAKKD